MSKGTGTAIPADTAASLAALCEAGLAVLRSDGG